MTRTESQQQAWAEVGELLQALTDSETHSALAYLAGFDPAAFRQAVKVVKGDVR